MKTSHILSAVILAIPCIAVGHGRALAAEVRAGKKHRVIATTDGEGDDRCSMVRENCELRETADGPQIIANPT